MPIWSRFKSGIKHEVDNRRDKRDFVVVNYLVGNVAAGILSVCRNGAGAWPRTIYR